MGRPSGNSGRNCPCSAWGSPDRSGQRGCSSPLAIAVTVVEPGRSAKTSRNPGHRLDFHIHHALGGKKASVSRTKPLSAPLPGAPGRHSGIACDHHRKIILSLQCSGRASGPTGRTDPPRQRSSRMAHSTIALLARWLSRSVSLPRQGRCSWRYASPVNARRLVPRFCSASSLRRSNRALIICGATRALFRLSPCKEIGKCCFEP